MKPPARWVDVKWWLVGGCCYTDISTIYTSWSNWYPKNRYQDIRYCNRYCISNPQLYQLWVNVCNIHSSFDIHWPWILRRNPPFRQDIQQQLRPQQTLHPGVESPKPSAGTWAENEGISPRNIGESCDRMGIIIYYNMI